MATVITDQEKLKKWIAAGSPGQFAQWQPPEISPATQAATAAQIVGTNPDYYGLTQEKLYKTGSGILEGDIPDYYKGIGEEGGESFENMLNLVKRDVAGGINEDIVRRGVSRGGLATHLTAKTMADTSIAARENERLRALKGKQDLLDRGITTMSDVRSGALDLEAIESRERLTNEALDYKKFQDDREKDAQKDQMLADIISGAIGGKAGIAGAVGDVLFGDRLFGKEENGGIVDKLFAPAATAAAVKAATATKAATPVATALGQPVLASQTAALQTPIGSALATTATATALLAPVIGLGYGISEFIKSKNKDHTVAVEEVRQTLGEFYPNIPQTTAAMIDMRTEGVWDEYKNLLEHTNNIDFVKTALEDAGQQMTPELDKTMADIMRTGISHQNELTEFTKALQSKGVLPPTEVIQKELSTVKMHLSGNLPLAPEGRQQLIERKNYLESLLKGVA